MKVILFGATGMVGQGVLRECLRDDGVEAVLAVGRSSTGQTHPKLRELIRKDLFDFGAAGADLQGYDACFFCLGVSSAGMSEADYTRLTYDLTLGWAQALARADAAMTFVYVSVASRRLIGASMSLNMDLPAPSAVGFTSRWNSSIRSALMRDEAEVGPP